MQWVRLPYLPEESKMPTMKAVATEWLQSFDQSEECNLYKYVVDNYVCRFIGDYELFQLTDEAFQEYYALIFFSQTFRERRRQFNTNYYADVLAEICNYAVEHKFIDSLTPPAPSRVQKATAISYEPPNMKNLQILLSHESDSPVAIVIQLALEAGLKRNEIAALQWKSVNLGERTIQIEDRLIPITDPLMETLRDVLDSYHKKSEFVVTSNRGKAYNHDVSISTLLSNAAKQRNMESITVSQLRHYHIFKRLETTPVEDFPQLARQLGYDSALTLIRMYYPYINKEEAEYELSKSGVLSQQELVRLVSRVTGVPLNACNAIITTFIKVVEGELPNGEIQLLPIGTIFTFEENERKVYDFQNRQTVSMPAQRMIGFKPAFDFFKSINDLPEDYIKQLYSKFYDNDEFYHYNGKHVFR